MKIIVWGINYTPELTGIAPYNVSLCEFLQARGHAVEMVTSFAYYPEWRKRPEDRWHVYRTDVIREVAVHRCWLYVPRKVSALKRIIHEGSFVLSSFLRLLVLPKADVMVVVSPPLLVGAAAWLLRLIKGAPFVFHVQDLQPDAAVGLGMLKSGFLTRTLYRLEALSYRAAARVSGISSGMLLAFEWKGVPHAKRLFFPNSVRLARRPSAPVRGRFRARMKYREDEFVALYSGNVGMKQGLGVLLEAAAFGRDPRVQVVICGDGAGRQSLEENAASRGLKNVRFLPLQDQDAYAEMMADADVCLITQQAGTGQFFFPSKMLTILAAGKPVLAVADADSELAIAVSEGGFGVCVGPKAPEELARVLESLVNDRAVLEEMGRQGRTYVQRFEAERVLGEFEKSLEALRPGAKAKPAGLPVEHSSL